MMFLFKTVGFDAQAEYNVLPVPPKEDDDRFGMRIVSSSFADRVATILFPSEEDRDQAIDDFVSLVNESRAQADKKPHRLTLAA
jgi:hypothetical protein